MAIAFGFKKYYQFIFGKTIKSRTDNKASEYILGPRKGIPQTSDTRLQRYAYFLSGFRDKMEQRNSKVDGNCDALLRLPIHDDTETKYRDEFFLRESFLRWNYFIQL